MYKAGFHPAAEFWQRLSVECGCASVCSTTEGRWHSLPQPLTPLALRFATLWLGPWIVNSRLSLQRHSFERDKQEKMGSQHLGEQPEVGKALYGHYQTGCWGVMRLAELVPGCPQFLPGKVLPCSDHPPPSLKGTGKGWSKGCKSHALGCLHILLTSCLFLSRPPTVPSSWCVLGKALEGKMVLLHLQPTLHLQARPSAQRAPEQGRKAGNPTAMETPGCRQAASPSMQDTQILLLYLHTTGQDVQPPICWWCIQMNQPALCNT